MSTNESEGEKDSTNSGRSESSSCSSESRESKRQEVSGELKNEKGPREISGEVNNINVEIPIITKEIPEIREIPGEIGPQKKINVRRMYSSREKEEIVSSLRKGISMKALKEEYGVSKGSVYKWRIATEAREKKNKRFIKYRAKRRTKPYTNIEKERAIDIYLQHGMERAVKDTGASSSSIKKWIYNGNGNGNNILNGNNTLGKLEKLSTGEFNTSTRDIGIQGNRDVGRLSTVEIKSEASEQEIKHEETDLDEKYNFEKPRLELTIGELKYLMKLRREFNFHLINHQ